jgi:hypothetical protein
MLRFKKPAPPAWRSRRREIKVDGCRVVFDDWLMDFPPEAGSSVLRPNFDGQVVEPDSSAEM